MPDWIFAAAFLILQWYVDTESAACLFVVDDLKIYIEILKIVAAFLQEKCVED